MSQKFTDQSQKTIEFLKSEFNTVKTGRANPSLLDNVMVEAWGSKMPVNQVCSVTAMDATLLVVKPFDKTLLKAVDSAIREANLGVNPVADSDMIRVPIPPLTEETRKLLVKRIYTFAEDARIAIRKIRQEFKQDLEKRQKDSIITLDQLEVEEKKLQSDVDNVNKLIDDLAKQKEKELMTV